MKKAAAQFKWQNGDTVSRKTSTALAPLHQFRIGHAQSPAGHVQRQQQPKRTRYNGSSSVDMAEKDDSFLGGKEAGLLIGFSRDTIEKRATPWEDEHVPFKIRYVEAVLDKGAKPVRRYFKPNVLAFLRRPPRRDNGPVYIPIFKTS
jgi:hypothetical protein